jgi:hypothetical protein
VGGMGYLLDAEFQEHLEQRLCFREQRPKKIDSAFGHFKYVQLIGSIPGGFSDH